MSEHPEVAEPDTRPRCRNGRCQRMNPGLCDRCAEHVARILTELADLVPRLADNLAPGSGGDGPRVSGTREAPLPVREAVLSMVGPAAGRDRAQLDRGDARVGEMQYGPEPVLSVLETWARHVADERGLHPPAPARLRLPARLPGAPFGPETAVQQRRRLDRFAAGNAATLYERRAEAARVFLVRHHEWATRQPWADEYAGQVHDAWQAVRVLVGAKPLRHHLDGVACPRCDAMGTLYRDDGGAEVYCDRPTGGCGATMPEEDYAFLTRLLAYQVRQEGVA